MMQEYEITELIPQRSPIIMVDRLLEVTDNEAVTCFTITEDNIFLDNNGTLKESGIIENIAQSASAMYGYEHQCHGGMKAPVGYIGEIRNFTCNRCPSKGEKFITTITRGIEIGGVTEVTGIASVENEIIAQTRLKIFMKK